MADRAGTVEIAVTELGARAVGAGDARRAAGGVVLVGGRVAVRVEDRSQPPAGVVAVLRREGRAAGGDGDDLRDLAVAVVGDLHRRAVALLQNLDGPFLVGPGGDVAARRAELLHRA